MNMMKNGMGDGNRETKIGIDQVDIVPRDHEIGGVVDAAMIGTGIETIEVEVDVMMGGHRDATMMTVIAVEDTMTETDATKRRGTRNRKITNKMK